MTNVTGGFNTAGEPLPPERILSSDATKGDALGPVDGWLGDVLKAREEAPPPTAFSHNLARAFAQNQADDSDDAASVSGTTRVVSDNMVQKPLSKGDTDDSGNPFFFV